MKISEIFYYFLYFILNFLSYILVIIFQNKLIISLPLSFHCKQILSSSLTIFFLYITRNKPGYIEHVKDIEKEKNETMNQTNINVELSPIININIIPNNGCEICKIKKLPLRSLHCKNCQKCVKGFDHHCWILGGCIGENNRFKFILFLFFQNISTIFSTYGILKIINEKKILNEYKKNLKNYKYDINKILQRIEGLLDE